LIREIWEWDELLLPYRQAVRELCVKFEAYTSEFGIHGEHSPIEAVKGRVKRVSSILEKAARKQIKYADFDELALKVGDIAGVRFICRFEDDIEKVVDLVHKRNGVDIQILDERDYINKVKKSGYRSYHLHIKYSVSMCGGTRDVITEIQIRTMAMNIWASTEHSLKYKYNDALPENLQKRLSRSAEVAFLLDRELGIIREEIIEARKLIQTKHDLGDEILRNIKALHGHNPQGDIADLNKEFFTLNEEHNIEKLSRFNQRLRVMAQMYTGVEG
jgi:putative GTP pyrophosphokinase